MGFFSKKEKSPEEKLVDELVGSGFSVRGNLIDVLDSRSARIELQEIVQEAWKKGASVIEIQKVYDENLTRLRSLSENKEHNTIKNSKEGPLSGNKEYSTAKNLKEEPEPVSLREKLIYIIGIIIVLSVIVGPITYLIFFSPAEEVNFNDATIGGLEFKIPNMYKLYDTNENRDAFFNTYKHEHHTRHDAANSVSYLEIYVYKSKSVQQVVSSISSEGWYVHNASYGDYSGYRLERPVFKGCWFIFKKNGKTIGIYGSNQFIRDNMKKIIN